jgi:hypothetical protein
MPQAENSISERFDYKAYLNSKEWKTLRKSLIEERGGYCERCGSKDKSFHIHHLTYDRIGQELPEDLQVLCKDCHKNEHDGRIFNQSGGFLVSADHMAAKYLELIDSCPSAAKLFYWMGMNSQRDEDTGECFADASQTKALKQLGMPRKTQWRAMKVLLEQGFVEPHPEFSKTVLIPFWLVWHGQRPNQSKAA